MVFPEVYNGIFRKNIEDIANFLNLKAAKGLIKAGFPMFNNGKFYFYEKKVLFQPKPSGSKRVFFGQAVLITHFGTNNVYKADRWGNLETEINPAEKPSSTYKSFLELEKIKNDTGAAIAIPRELYFDFCLPRFSVKREDVISSLTFEYEERIDKNSGLSKIIKKSRKWTCTDKEEDEFFRELIFYSQS